MFATPEKLLVTVAGSNNGSAVVSKQMGVDGAVEATTERGDGYVAYRLTINRAALKLSGVGDLRINLLVNDSDDGKTRKQALVWTPGLLDETDSATWYRLTLGE